MSALIRVLCVDDHRLVRDGIALIISSQPDLEVVGFAATSDEAVAQFARFKPDITLMDLRLGFLINFHSPLIKDGIQRVIR